jgi:hypothetical protein
MLEERSLAVERVHVFSVMRMCYFAANGLVATDSSESIAEVVAVGCARVAMARRRVV